MDISAKPNAVQSYQAFLYERALHPELFDLCERRVVNSGEYEFEAWIMAGGHLLRFERGPLCACELVTDREDAVPQQGLVEGYLCAGEREHEHAFKPHAVNYLASVQTESLTENLYLNTLDELRAFGAETSALMHNYEDEAGPCLSMVDIQRYAAEVHAQCYHLRALSGMVLRTQAIFEHKPS